MKSTYLLAILFLSSCINLKSDPLELALNSAGDNRKELEYVLSHYSKNPGDSLKYRAARYLIENMPAHYSYVMTDAIAEHLNRIEFMMDSLKKAPFPVKDSTYRKILESYNNLRFEEIPDTKIIQSKFLINNIEHSFKVWTGQKWAQHISFDEFCELILPYKVFEGQALDNWKEFFYDKYNGLLSNLKYTSIYSNSSYMACEILNRALHDTMQPALNSDPHKPILKLKTLWRIPSGPCDEYTLMATALMRANGIPAGMDLTPQWPFRSLGHSWNILQENTKKNIVFEGAASTIGVLHKKDHIMAKVYRCTYKINSDLYKLIKTEKTVPRAFSNPMIEDVTEEYMSTIDMKLKTDTDDGYAYLAVFDNKNWEILAWGTCKNGTAAFPKIGKDVLYLPVKYKNNTIEPIGDPFTVNLKNAVTTVSADTSKKQTLRLLRKYPMLHNVYISDLRKLGAKIQAANKPDFSDSVTFHVFSDFENDIAINKEKKEYRYWRFFSANDGFANVAELKFYQANNSSPLQGEIIGTDGSWQPGDKFKKEVAFDGDLLTFFDAPSGTGSWVGLDLKTPVAVNRVTCIMRGDGNDIEIGDQYELVYWMKDQWVSLGTKEAKDIILEFDNCPTGALFLLHDRTKGSEERIFTYENGKQIWW